MTFSLLYVSIQGASVVGLAAVVVLLHRLVGRADTLARRLRPLDAVADRLSELAAPGQHAAGTTLRTETPPEGVHARSRRAPGLVSDAAASRAMDPSVATGPVSRRSPIVHEPVSSAPVDEHGRRPSSVRVPS